MENETAVVGKENTTGKENTRWIPNIRGDTDFSYMMQICDAILGTKGKDYTQGEPGDEGRLRNFYEVARRKGITPFQALGVYLQKHTDAIDTFLMKGRVESEPIDTRIADAINYLLLLFKMIRLEEFKKIKLSDNVGMTIYNCSICGESHDSSKVCTQVIPIPPVTKSIEELAHEFRAALFTIHAPGHSLDDEKEGWFNYGTDELRRLALDHIGFCWAIPGEMSPECGCEWSKNNPHSRSKRLVDKIKQLEERTTALEDENAKLKISLASMSEVHTP